MSRRPAFVPALILGAAVVSCSNQTNDLLFRSGTVMGTLAELKVVEAPGAEGRLDAAFAELVRVQKETTPYSPDGNLARLAKGEAVTVSSDTDALLSLAGKVADVTDGAFDPTAGALVEVWGFPQDPRLPDSAEVAEARSHVGAQRLRRVADRQWQVTAGTQVDLGGIAKGWGVDRAADALAGESGACLVNVGGDLAVRGTKPRGVPWRVGVQDPRDPSRLFVTLSLSGTRAVATSGDYQRYVEVDGVRYHHLLDPRTGYPARGASSATVVAGSCARADAWATAAFVLGAEAGLAALEREADLEGMVVTVDAAGELVRHETSGFAAYRTE